MKVTPASPLATTNDDDNDNAGVSGQDQRLCTSDPLRSFSPPVSTELRAVSLRVNKRDLESSHQLEDILGAPRSDPGGCDHAPMTCFKRVADLTDDERGGSSPRILSQRRKKRTACALILTESGNFGSSERKHCGPKKKVGSGW